jgi:hypothetical protein
MKLEQVLKDWSEYDHYKSSRDEAANSFLTEENWEVNFLIKKITDNYPELSQPQILDAILTCGRTISKPRQRRLLVQCVMMRLDIL